MMQSVQPVASERPSCLFGDAAGAADCQDCTLAGRKVYRVAIAELAPVFDHKSIRHELHRRLLLSMVATTVQKCRPFCFG